MKKINNKYRNNGNNNYNNQIYSLNYKFDSSSPAGKFNGTALDLIKKYNELAKDAQSNNDYIAAEVYRQYAEHYRKIVTDINEKKMQRNNNFQRDNERQDNVSAENPAAEPACETAVSTENAAQAAAEQAPAVEKKEFKVIEIKESETPAETAQPKKRIYRRRTTAPAEGGDSVPAV